MIRVIIRKNKCKCAYCGSLLRYEVNDLRENRQLGTLCGHYIICPVCKGETRVSSTI